MLHVKNRFCINFFYFFLQERCLGGGEKRKCFQKSCFGLCLVLEPNKIAHVWNGKQVHNSCQDQDCTGKTNSWMTDFPERPRSERSVSWPYDLRLKGHQHVIYGLEWACSLFLWGCKKNPTFSMKAMLLPHR